MNLLVTGRSGCGKTTVCKALTAMKMPTLDADRVKGLVGWVDRMTLDPVEVDYSQPIDTSKVGWFWVETVLQKLLTQNDDLILCGSAHNQLGYYPLFDRVILLDVSAQEQTRRIQTRTEHDYAKISAMSERVVREQAQLLASSRGLGAIIMNAERPPREIAIDIVRHLR